MLNGKEGKRGKQGKLEGKHTKDQGKRDQGATKQPGGHTADLEKNPFFSNKKRNLQEKQGSESQQETEENTRAKEAHQDKKTKSPPRQEVGLRTAH